MLINALEYWSEGRPFDTLDALVTTTDLSYWDEDNPVDLLVPTTCTPATNRSASTCDSPSYLRGVVIPNTNQSPTICPAGLLIWVSTPATAVSHCSCSQAGTGGAIVGIPSNNSITTMQAAFLEAMTVPSASRSASICPAANVEGVLYPNPWDAPLQPPADRLNLSGNIDIGYHGIIITWYSSSLNKESPASPMRYIQNTNNYKQTEVWLPDGSLFPTGVTHWNLYMTQAADTEEQCQWPQLVAQVPIGTTYYVINVADVLLGAYYEILGPVPCPMRTSVQNVAGNMTNGIHSVKQTWIVPTYGESDISGPSNDFVIDDTHGKVDLEFGMQIKAPGNWPNCKGPPNVTGFIVYMTKANGSVYYYAGTYAYADHPTLNIADEDLGPEYEQPHIGSKSTCGEPDLFLLLIPDNCASLTTMESEMLKSISGTGMFLLID